MTYILTFLLFFPIVYILAKLVMLLPQFGQMPKGEHLTQISQSPNYIKDRFRTKVKITNDMSFSKVPVLIKQNTDTKKQKRPSQVLRPLKRSTEEFLNFPSDKTRVTWFGHSAILLEIDGLKVLIDPMLGQAAAPFPFMIKRFSKELPISIDELPDIDLVIYSHDHYDHLDYGSVLKLKPKVKRWITTLGVGSHLKRWGIDSSLITEHDWWEEVKFKSLTLTSTPNKHFSGRKTNDRNKTLWSSWVIKAQQHNIFFSSDSGYWTGFKDIGEKHGPFDLCMVECGQYNHLWRENHMFPEESLQAFKDLKGQWMMPIHWGGFSLAPHDWRDPIERLFIAAEKENITNISTPVIGDSIILNENYPQTKWWKEIN